MLTQNFGSLKIFTFSCNFNKSTFETNNFLFSIRAELDSLPTDKKLIFSTLAQNITEARLSLSKLTQPAIKFSPYIN